MLLKAVHGTSSRIWSLLLERIFNYEKSMKVRMHKMVSFRLVLISK